MPRAELLVAGVDLVEAVLVDQEVTVDGDHGDDRPMVNYFLLDVLLLGRHAVLGNLEFLALLDRLLAGLRGFRGSVVPVAAFFDQSVYFCVV